MSRYPDDRPSPSSTPEAPSRLSFLRRPWFIVLVLAACAGLAVGYWLSEYIYRHSPRGLKEAVFRAMFAQAASSSGVTVYFLADGRDESPDSAFMRRFRGSVPPVRPFGGMALHDETGVTDARTGERGLLFVIASVQMLGPDEADVSAWYLDGIEAPCGFEVRCRWVRGRWEMDRLLNGLTQVY